MACSETPVKTHGVGFFLELRKRLQSGLLIVGKAVAASPGEVVVTGGDSSLHVRAPGGELHLALPAGVSHEQGSCTPTPGGEEELHFRLRITVDQSKDEEASDDVMERLRAKESYCFNCQGCKTRLLEDRVFKRVLPLPNGNWNSIVDDWCCHPDPFANKLLPRADDCLLGDTFLLLARDSSCEHTLTVALDPAGAEGGQDPKKPCRRLSVVSCASCLSVLGEAITADTLKLYITQLVVEPSVGDREADTSQPNRSLFLEKTIAARLLELSNKLSTFHFSVQTPDEKAFLLVWLLNSDSIVASVPEMCLRGERSAEMRVGGERSAEMCVRGEESVGPTALDRPSPRAARTLKLLYIACSDGGILQREVVTNWELNAIGHPLVLPPKVCEELLEVMEDSNASLPSSLRCMRSYEVAYLRL